MTHAVASSTGAPPRRGARHRDRMRRFRAAGLYLVTSQELSGGRTTLEILRAALDAGLRLVQLREKTMPVRALYRLAEAARTLTADAGALLIINDRLDLALAVDADGVHLGQDDFPLAAARRLAPDLILGASTHSRAEALAAQRDGASYVNIGPVFPTQTKTWHGTFLGLAGIEAMAPCLRVPWTVMGGIKTEHVPCLRAAGARTLAVVTAVTAAPDPAAAVRTWLGLLNPARARGAGRRPGA